MSNNPYYDPEDNGFVLTYEEDFGGAYEPYVYAVLTRKEDGKRFWDFGSSCSCYGPMDDCTVDGLKPLPETIDELRAALREFDTTADRLLAAAEGK